MIIAVDFDGTIVEHAYPKIGKPIPFAIDTLKRLQKEQHQIILWSVREGKLLKEAVDYCHERGFDFFAVNSNFPDENAIHDGQTARKLTADIFIDDRNLGGLPEWGVIYQMIHSGSALEPIPYAGVVNQEVKRKIPWWQKIFN
ncbi:MAG: HAD family hydrolase [Paludibacteraceae bacterium]|nr:HAD family hydrolase [Paludibacteraceae bacterium]